MHDNWNRAARDPWARPDSEGQRKIILVMEGLAYAKSDANCCPSVPLQFTLKADPKGNWKLISKKVVKK